MPGRFSNIKFNLLRALEIFGDMNHLDMEVAAPPSSPDHYKEYEVARRLNACLTQMIDDGIFEDCDYRDVSTSNDSLGCDDDSMDDEYVNSRSNTSSAASRGFDTSHLRNRDNYDDHDASVETSNDESGASGSEEVDQNSGRSSLGRFRVRFKRYIRRILPGSGNRLGRVEPLRDDEASNSSSGPDLDQMSTSQPSDDDDSASGSLSASGSVHHELAGSRSSSLGSYGNSLLSASSSGGSSAGRSSLGSSGSRSRSRSRSGSSRNRASRSNSSSGRR